MKPLLYYRASMMDAEERNAAEQHFQCTDLLCEMQNSCGPVVMRYSALPFLDNIYKELVTMGLEPINSLSSMKWIMNLQNWVEALGDMTFKTWDRLEDLPQEGPFVLKGATNSKKHYWNTHMFAQNKKEAIHVYGLLAEDCMIGEQKIYIRKFEPLVTYIEGINGIPVTKEFRLFFHKKTLLCSGFYWQNYEEDLPFIPEFDVPAEFYEEAARRAHEASGAVFFVMDVGQKVDGSWVVIEVNQGEMSGLSCCDPRVLYENLAEAMSLDSVVFTDEEIEGMPWSSVLPYDDCPEFLKHVTVNLRKVLGLENP